MRSYLHKALDSITFKRFVILVLLTLLALPILKGVFVGDSDTQFLSENLEYKVIKGDEFSSNNILAVKINGLILTESSEVPNPFDVLSNEGITYGYDVKDTLMRAADDDSVKGVLLQINSPGGTIAGSKAIADGIEYYKKSTGNPVYAHIRDVGASGAYWAAIVADKVVVDTGSMVGSIGVLMGPFTYYDNVIEEGSILNNVVTEGGIEHTFFTAGQYKDTGSPYRQLTPEERQHWQTSLDNEYDIFVDHVSKYRKIPQDQIRNTIKALPYENERAKSLNLVDAIGSEEDVLTELLAASQIAGEDYKVVTEVKSTGVLGQLFGVLGNTREKKVTVDEEIFNTPLYLYARTYNFN
jgi:protease IV